MSGPLRLNQSVLTDHGKPLVWIELPPNYRDAAGVFDFDELSRTELEKFVFGARLVVNQHILNKKLFAWNVFGGRIKSGLPSLMHRRFLQNACCCERCKRGIVEKQRDL